MSPDLQPGDIVACNGTDCVSRGIRGLTLSAFSSPRLGPSHVALLVPHQIGGHHLVWVESTTLTHRPCLWQGRVVSGWQMHGVEERLSDYRRAGASVDLYRLHPMRVLGDHERRTLTATAIEYFAKQPPRYDLRGALWSGSRLLQLTCLYPRAELNSLFCSELVAAVLQSVNRLCIDVNPGRFNPGRLLRRLVRAGTYVLQRTYYPDHVEEHRCAC